MIRVRLGGQVSDASLRILHGGGAIPELRDLFEQVGVEWLSPTFELSESELLLGIGPAREIDLGLRPGADPVAALAALRGSALVERAEEVEGEPRRLQPASPLPYPDAARERAEPEPVPAAAPAAHPTPAYAGFWIRFAAWTIDLIVLGFILVVPVDRLIDPDDFSGWFSLSFAVGLLYCAGFEASPARGTPGKLAVGVAAVDQQGGQLSLAHAVWRNTMKLGLSFGWTLLLTVFPPVALLPFADSIILAASENKQSLHDLLAGTLVVKR